MMGKTRRIAAIARGGPTVLLLTIGAALAQAQGLDEVHEFHIEAQPLDAALIEFSEQADLQLMVQTELVTGRHSAGISGALTASDALLALLNDTNLAFEAVGEDTVAVSQADVGGDSDSGNRPAAGATTPIVMAQNQTRMQRNQASQPNERESERGRRPIEEIVVTGTHIRGIAPESSPVRVFDREDIRISGAATAQDFIQTLTANFGGGANEDIVGGLPNNDSAQFNSLRGGAFGSSVNLRGLGSDSTLILLNGHRLAPSSGIGHFVDISMIPASALERIEVLTDGASSIYGADAVAGVVNFILRDDFNGVETSFRYGTVTEGDMDEYRASITGGMNWDAGDALVVYEYFNKDNLSASDRSFSQTAPLPSDLLPSQERHSVLASVSHELTPFLDVFSDLGFSERRATSDITLVTTLDTFRLNRNARNINVSAGGSWKTSNDWIADFSGTYSSSHIKADQLTTIGTPDLRNIDADIWTADIKASGALFSLPGGEVKLAVGGHFRSEHFANTDIDADETDGKANRSVYSAFGEAFIPVVGPDNAVPGIDRFEINVSGRIDNFSDFGSSLNPKIGVLWSPINALRFRGSYSTSFNPPPLGRVGATDLVAQPLPTSLVNSIFGLTAGDPSIADVVVLSVTGTSRDLEAETSRSFTAGMDFEEEQGRHKFAVSWTYFDIKFQNRLGKTPCPGCVNNLSFDAPNVAFNHPERFPDGAVIFSPTNEDITNLINSVDLLSNPFGVDPSDAEIINFVSVIRNLSLTFVKGVDFHAAYTFEANAGDFMLSIDGTYLFDYEQKGSVLTPIVENLNTQFNPVDLKLRSRLGYSGDGFTANIFVNYVDSYRVDTSPSAAPINSWTTVDLSLSYDTSALFGGSIFDNTTIRFSAINLFNEEPPLAPTGSFSTFGYDATNASPLGRFIAFELAKGF